MKKIFLLLLSSLIFIFSISCNSIDEVSQVPSSQYIEIPSLYTDIFVPFTDYVSEKSFDFVKEELSSFHYAITIKDNSVYISDDLGHNINIIAKNQTKAYLVDNFLFLNK